MNHEEDNAYFEGAGMGLNEVGVWKYTASEIKAKSEEVNSAAMALASEINEYGLIESKAWFESDQNNSKNIERHDRWFRFDKGYSEFYTNDWSIFHSKMAKSYSIPSLFDSNVKAIMDYAKRINEWRKAFEVLTNKKSDTPPLTVKEKPDEPFLGIGLDRIFWGVVILAGGYLTVEAIKAIASRPSSRSSTPRRLIANR